MTSISTLVILLVLLAIFAKAQITEPPIVVICCVDWNVDPPTFETLEVQPQQWDNCPNDMLGPCTDYLGQICDDQDFCTLDYDENAIECLPYPRARVPNCPREDAEE